MATSKFGVEEGNFLSLSEHRSPSTDPGFLPHLGTSRLASSRWGTLVGRSNNRGRTKEQAESQEIRQVIIIAVAWEAAVAHSGHGSANET